MDPGLRRDDELGGAGRRLAAEPAPAYDGVSYAVGAGWPIERRQRGPSGGPAAGHDRVERTCRASDGASWPAPRPYWLRPKDGPAIRWRWSRMSAARRPASSRWTISPPPR